mmetsp:Transcript_37226/g.73089  ORF Transcript_37226/g.73089 Transcript_37226/m.73089 type:complete len:91 (+) Transcript_37226:770-1042(+)
MCGHTRSSNVRLGRGMDVHRGGRRCRRSIDNGEASIVVPVRGGDRRYVHDVHLDIGACISPLSIRHQEKGSSSAWEVSSSTTGALSPLPR